MEYPSIKAALRRNSWRLGVVAATALLLAPVLSGNTSTDAKNASSSLRTLQEDKTKSYEGTMNKESNTANPQSSADTTATGGQPSASSTSVVINGESMAVPQNGTMQKESVSSDGTTKTNVSISNSSSSDDSASSSSVQVNINSSSITSTGDDSP